MRAIRRPYRPESDVVGIRDLLSETFPFWPCLSNWRIERWNYCRYFVAPMLGDPDAAESARSIAYWEATVGVWEDDGGRIVGAVNTEAPLATHSEFNHAWIQRRPGTEGLLDEMLAYAEEVFLHPTTGRVTVYAGRGDLALTAALARRGYACGEGPGLESERRLNDLPAARLPRGYTLRSMAEANDLAMRAETFGRAFGHQDPLEWPSVRTIATMQTAPDYRPDLDLMVVNPDGRGVAACTLWWDAPNRLGILEPVGTHPDFRRQGFGRAVVTEAMRRAAALGARHIWVGSSQPFYRALGFVPRATFDAWVK